MRLAFAEAVAELAGQDTRIVLLTGDLGYTVFEPFMKKFPERFFNVGVAEQNMIGLATGLAEAGFIPFVYSIITFASLRPYEFIRNGPILHQLPVRIVGIGAGFEYGHAGATHHGLEDAGVMRLQPGLTVISPCDHQQARTAILKTWDLPSPVYYRLGKDDKTVIPDLNGQFDLGRAQTIRDGKDVVIIGTGSIVGEAVIAAEALDAHNLSCAVIAVASLNPPPTTDLVESLSRFPWAITVEEHYIVGGLGSLVAEVIATHNLNCKLVRHGVSVTPDGMSGSQQYLRHTHRLSSDDIVQSIRKKVDSHYQ
jgi:transketolase